MSVKDPCLVIIILNTDSIRVNVISVQVSIYNGYCFSSYPDSLLSSLLSSSIHRVIQYPDYFNNSLFNKYLLWNFSVHTWITKETLNKFHSHSHWHCCQIHRFSTQLKTILATSCVTTNRTNTHHHAFSHASDSLILSFPSMVFLSKLLMLYYQDLIAQMMVAEYLPASFLKFILIIWWGCKATKEK